MKLLFSLVVFFSIGLKAQTFPAFGYKDRTEEVLKEHNKMGLQLMEEKVIAEVRVKLYLSVSAKEAIQNRQFLVPGTDFDQDSFNAYILKTFESSLNYFRKINPSKEIKELHLALVDEGGDRGTISDVPMHSRLIQLHLARWHKYFVRNDQSFVNVSSIHEFAHVINYMYAPRETKLHREMVGVLVECLNFIHINGVENFLKNYLRSFTRKISEPEALLAGDYTNMNVVRNLAFTLFKNIYAGQYKVSSDLKKTTEKFVIFYLKNPMVDRAGFDASLRGIGVLDMAGAPLTLARLQEDTKESLQLSAP